MVAKIYAPAPSVSSAVNYNEKKVAEGKASVIFSSRIADPRHPMKTFEQYEKGSLRTQNMSFHASINPSRTDRIPEEKMADFIRDYMEKMGYGKQPYIVYKHTDTGRAHWHVCSSRVDENGHKIPDFQERKRSQQALKELMQKYDFEIGKSKKEKAEKGSSINPYNGFAPKAGEFQTQMEKIAALAMQYHFKEDRHFDVILKSFNVEAVHRTDGTTALIGLDPKTGKHVTEPITSKDIPTLDAIRDHIAECKKNNIKTMEKQRVVNITSAGLKKCRTLLHLRRYLNKSDIYMDLSVTKDGKIFGVTLVDHHNKCVFKLSELDGLKASMFEALRLSEAAKQQNKAAEKEEKKQVGENSSLNTELTGVAMSAVGRESSRQNEDEEMMTKGKKM